MSEFSNQEAKDWLALALARDVSIGSAIYYSLFFECQRDPEKLERAIAHFKSVMGAK